MVNNPKKKHNKHIWYIDNNFFFNLVYQLYFLINYLGRPNNSKITL